MKIKSVRSVRVRLPEQTSKVNPRRPSWNKSAKRAMPINLYPWFSRYPSDMPGGQLEAVWVRVVAEDGTWGLGECAFGAPVSAFINTVIAPIIEGQNCMAIEHLNDLVVRVSQRFGTSGTASTAMSGVDLALWDLKAKQIGEPLWRLLEGAIPRSKPMLAVSTSISPSTTFAQDVSTSLRAS